MTKPPCDSCGKPIRDGEASISANTPTTSEHWHLGCCPWVLRGAPAAFMMREDASCPITLRTDKELEQV
jgi:hypothetical protein